tara:strand:- start:2215 stop:2604 length:390 start_codon:yes stop_codon:yes gene_type:complete
MTIDLSKIKLDLIVKNRKAELYLEEVREDYYLPLTKDYQDCVRHVKKFIKIRKFPWYVHIGAQTAAFIIDPIGFIKLKWQGYNFLIESYWELKRLVKECEMEFEATEKAIEKSEKIINNIQKAIDDKVE